MRAISVDMSVCVGLGYLCRVYSIVHIFLLLNCKHCVFFLLPFSPTGGFSCLQANTCRGLCYRCIVLAVLLGVRRGQHFPLVHWRHGRLDCARRATKLRCGCWRGGLLRLRACSLAAVGVVPEREDDHLQQHWDHCVDSDGNANPHNHDDSPAVRLRIPAAGRVRGLSFILLNACKEPVRQSASLWVL